MWSAIEWKIIAHLVNYKFLYSCIPLFQYKAFAKVYHFIGAKISSRQNLHVWVVVKGLLNTYVHNQRQCKSKMYKFEYIIYQQVVVLTQERALYKYCKHQKAWKLYSTLNGTLSGKQRYMYPKPYKLKTCY